MADGTANRIKFHCLDLIKVSVGDSSDAIQVPKNLICARSPFFTAACSQRWDTEGRQVTHLPEDTSAVFSIYLQLTHTNGVFVEHDTGTLGLESIFTCLVETYVLADKFGDPQSMNLVMEEIVRQCNAASVAYGQFLARAIRYAYDHTTDASSPLRRGFVDFTVYVMNCANLDGLLHEMGPAADFLYDVAMASVRWRQEKGSFLHVFVEKQCAEYHVMA
ncbi:hypothetical protein LTR85_003205 [Meristemomyces frigidus]|nr:hypothetical protein LTR85_003205 [Meristemomyces frigidus]